MGDGALCLVPAFANLGDPFDRCDDLLNPELTDEPLELRDEHYTVATDAVVDTLSTLRIPPESIYRLGRIGAPGVSDLDLVVVLPTMPTDWRLMEPSSYDDSVRQVLVHPPYVCGEGSWELLQGWLPAFDLVHVYGSHLPEPTIPAQCRMGLALGVLVDYLITKLPVDLVAALRMPRVPVRGLLAILHSLRYTDALARAAEIPRASGPFALDSRIDDLRAGWLELPPEARRTELVALSRLALNHIDALIHDVDHYLQTVIAESHIGLPSTRAVIGRVSEMHFGPCYDFPFNLAATMNRVPAQISDGWTHPSSYLAVLASYGASEPRLGSYIFGRRIPKSPFSGTGWAAGLEFHARSMSAYMDDAAAIGVPPLKYVALGYAPLPGYARAVLSYFMRLRGGESSIRRLPNALAAEVRRRAANVRRDTR